MSKPVLHIYTRVSSAAQEDHGTSLESQRTIGEDRAKALGFDSKVWNEGGKSSASDSLENRPVLVQLIGEVEAGNVKHIFVYAMDRLTRNDTISALIKHKLLQNDVQLLVPSGVYNLREAQSKLVFEIMSAFASYDNALRAERSRQGKLQKVRLGSWLGGPPPFGYKLVDKKLSPDEMEAKWVNEIFKWFLKGDSVRDISQKLLAEGVRTRRDNPKWSLGSLTALLGNTHYVGYYVVEDKKTGEKIRCECPAIVDQELYADVHALKNLRSYNRIREPAQKTFYLLKGLLVCGSCGNKLAARNSKKHYRQYYYCPRKERNFSAQQEVQCNNRQSLRLNVTDSLVWSNVVKSLIALPQADGHPVTLDTDTKDLAIKINKQNIAIKKLNKALDTAKDQIALLEADKLLGRRSEDEVGRIVKVVNEDLANTNRKLANAHEQLKNLQSEQTHAGWWDQFFGKVKDLNKLSDDERRMFLFKILDSIGVDGLTGGGHALTLSYRINVFDRVEPWEQEGGLEHLSPSQQRFEVNGSKKL